MFSNSQKRIASTFALGLALSFLLVWPNLAFGQASSCQNQCSTSDLKQCLNSGNYRTCGNYDSDKCLEWSDFTACSSNSVCFNGQCVANSKCQGDCQWDAISQCINSTLKQFCQNYDRESGLCLSWGQPVDCSGGSSCGYGQCSAQEIPEWSCENGHCVYKCRYSANCSDVDKYSYLGCSSDDVYWYSSNGNRQEKKRECQSEQTKCETWSGNYCNGNTLERFRICYKRGCNNGQCYEEPYTEKQKVKQCDQSQFCENSLCQTCQCLSGPCCDGCKFKPSGEVCDTQTIEKYGCPWGEGCSSDVGLLKQAGFRNCAGKSSACDGQWIFAGWTNWLKAVQCGQNQGCSAGQSTCQPKANCLIDKPQPPISPTSTVSTTSSASQNNSASSKAPLVINDLTGKKNRGAAYLVLAGFGKIIISWFFWLCLALGAIGIMVAKYAKLTSWLAKKQLEKLSSQYR